MSQIVSVTVQNLRSLPQRAAPSVVAIVGVAGVVAVLVAVLSMARGFQQTLAVGGSPDNVIIMRSGSSSELDSGLSRDQASIITEAPGLAVKDGLPIASPEGFAMVDLQKKGNGMMANVPLRGVEFVARDVRDAFTIVEGRMFEPGRRELIAGRAAAGQFEGLVVGQTLSLGQASWEVVGLFETDGSTTESELWIDSAVFQNQFNRTGYSVIYARIASNDSFAQFRYTLAADPRLSLLVQRESEYFASQSEITSGLITVIGYAVAFLMSLGAIFGALNTMYTAVADRSREIGTLRALGFGRLAIVISVLVEAIVLAVLGGLLGAGIAYLLFNGFAVSTLNFSSFTQVVFAFAVTPDLMIQGIVLAVLIGAVGGLAPAIRAARMPITSALRAT